MNVVANTLEGGGSAFATTHWTVVLTAQSGSPAARDALDELCSTYWRPVYTFLRREGRSREDAQDLTQGFFALLLERSDFDRVRRQKGRLRSYLLGSLKNFLSNDRRRLNTLKRGAGRPAISLEDLNHEESAGLENAALPADQLYDRRWALAMLDRVFARLATEYRQLGRPGLFDRLSESLSDESDHPSQAGIAREFGMTENAVKQALHRLRRRYRQLLLTEIANTVATPDDIESELRNLIAALRS